ncbi:MAG: SDR family oxidoreductase [Chloroflexi bacterium]|nr:MAG: SDR family oxidoreductase [Chloroflexota bacterium]
MTPIAIVTGGAGFIGSHLAQRLLDEGFQVRIIDNFSTGKRDNLAHLTGDFDLHEVSITDLDALKPIFADATYVFHHAALASVIHSIDDPLTSHQHNVNGTLNVLLAARDAGVRRVVYAASSAAYGDTDGAVNLETMLPAPISPYGVGKLVGEYYCRVFTEVYKLETVSLRYFNVFGPRQDPTSHYAAVIPKFITLMIDGRPPVIFGDGEQSRDFVYIDNIVHANMLAATKDDVAGGVFNIASGSNISLLTLVDKINAVLGTNIAPQHDAERPGDIKHSRTSIDHAREHLGYEPVITFDDALAKTVRWYQQQGG